VQYRRIHRRYDVAKTPYQRVMESPEVEEKVKKKLRRIYMSFNPAQLKRGIDDKLSRLFKVYQLKNKSQSIALKKKLKPTTVTCLIAEPNTILVT